MGATATAWAASPWSDVESATAARYAATCVARSLRSPTTATVPLGSKSSTQRAQLALSTTSSMGGSGKSDAASVASSASRPPPPATWSAVRVPRLSGMARRPGATSPKAAARWQSQPVTWTLTRNASPPAARSAATRSSRFVTSCGVPMIDSARRKASPAWPRRGRLVRARDVACTYLQFAPCLHRPMRKNRQTSPAASPFRSLSRSLWRRCRHVDRDTPSMGTAGVVRGVVVARGQKSCAFGFIAAPSPTNPPVDVRTPPLAAFAAVFLLCYAT
mmetsp:Transcript_19409/g.63804  ORF Transcript_19409/g.63804 Transcript_19409/m.63804 type:complete len:275 (+) Transcript_19409:203-1027(+)